MPETLLVVETDPETGLDHIVRVDPANVYRQPYALRGHVGWVDEVVWDHRPGDD